MKVENNAFGKRLERVLFCAEQKNISLAVHLGYDVSYISKWLNGKSVPSLKNKDDIFSKISDYIVENSSLNAKQKLKEEIGIKNDANLSNAIKVFLIQGYEEALGGNRQDCITQYNAKVLMYPSNLEVLEEIEKINFEDEIHICVLADLYVVDRSVKLRLAGIDKGRFLLSNIKSGIKYDMSIYLDINEMDIIYDTILLIHMLTAYSFIDFNLYKSTGAKGRLDYIVENQYASLGNLTDNGQCRYMVCIQNKNVINELFKSYTIEENQENLLFQKSDMSMLLLNQIYMQSLLSPNIKWLLGHMTEQLMPRDLFYEIKKQIEWKENEILQIQLEKINMLLDNIYAIKDMSLMFYESAIYDFMLNGEMDFFNTKVFMDKMQRVKCLEYLKEIVKNNFNIRISMVEGGFSNDFRYITNPCVFLSETVGYLRLENKKYSNNILLIKDKDIMEIFRKFYTAIWNQRQDVVVSDRRKIIDRIDYYIKSLHLMPDIE